MRTRLNLEVLPAAQDLGLGVVAWSPLEGGLISGGNALKPSTNRENRPSRQLELKQASIPSLWLTPASVEELGEKEAQCGGLALDIWQIQI